MSVSKKQQYNPENPMQNSCSAKSNTKGQNLLKRLASLTGASIAASNTLTGNTALGGDWNLKVTLGEIASHLVIGHDLQLTYQGVLAAGDLDTTFNGSGKVTTDFGSGIDAGYAITLDSSGKILVAGDTYKGSNSDIALVRYNSDGSLDTTFDTDGKVTTDLGSSIDAGYAITLDSSGKILVAGSTWNNGYNDIALVRYNSDGSLDTTFGTGGKVTTDFGSDQDQGKAITLDSSGKILVAGSTNNVGSNSDFALTRYNSNGSLDTTFGTGGKVTTAIGSDQDVGNAITLDNRGKILVAGTTNKPGNTSDFAITRYNTDGSLDTTFDTDGIVTTDIGIYDGGNAMTLDSSGKILVAGYSFNRSNFDMALMRYNSDGSLDTTFGTDGKVTTTIGYPVNQGRAMTLDSSGKILVAGHTSNGSNNDIALVRYNSNGSLDTSFGTGGKVTTAIGNSTDEANAITLDSRGKILVAGNTYNGSNFEIAVVRYIADATPTPTTDPIIINTPQLSNRNPGNPTNLPPNQASGDFYFLTDGDDRVIPSEAFGKVIVALSGHDQLTGSTSGDNISGNQGSDSLDGASGDDILYGGKGDDLLFGSDGNDLLSGNNDNDTVDGGVGNDTLYGGKEKDVLIGGSGQDELWGDQGQDVLYGGADNDVFISQVANATTQLGDANLIADFVAGDRIKLEPSLNVADLTFEAVNVSFDGAAPRASTAIKSGSNYLTIVYGVDQSVLTSSVFL